MTRLALMALLVALTGCESLDDADIMNAKVPLKVQDSIKLTDRLSVTPMVKETITPATARRLLHQMPSGGSLSVKYAFY